MTPSGTLRTAILAVIGLALAVAVGLAANAISRDSIGLAPTPAGSGVRLAPARTTSTAARQAPKAATTPAKKATKPKATTGTATTPPATTTTATTSGDDHGGESKGGSGSGGGSDSSGGSGKGRGGGDD
jgi:hypothetical protein